MDKQTLFAIVLSAGILMIWFGIQERTTQRFDPTANTSVIDNENQSSRDTEPTDIHSYTTREYLQNNIEELPPTEEITINTNIFKVVFSSKNGTIQSLKLQNTNAKENTPKNLEKDIEIIPNGELEQAFRILWGNEDSVENIENTYYNVRMLDDYKIEFYSDFISSQGIPFTVTKTYTFFNDEYVFELDINITNSQNNVLQLGDTYAYSLMYGPQLGPYTEVVDTQKSKQLSRRRMVVHDDRKMRYINVKTNREVPKDNIYKWVGITGRYISMIILTGSSSFDTIFSAYSTPGLISGAQILLRRPVIQSSAIIDKYRIFFGPNVRSTLVHYNNADDNSFGIQNAEFDDIKPRRLLSFLEIPIAALMKLLYTIIPNYGIVIIILTIIMRLITLPITRKSKANGEKMKSLAPKMQEIRTKYKEDPMRMNQEIMGLYKKEKISPFSTMLPLFVQIPFFLAMYRVIYGSIELWQAPFVGWINDLSIPDELVSFGNVAIPVLGWTSLHILPIMMLLTQFVSSFIMMRQQDHSAGSSRFMFIMSYVFPFMIFFALYNSPSGLIVYWICSNIFTVLSMMNWTKKRKAPELVINHKTTKRMIK